MDDLNMTETTRLRQLYAQRVGRGNSIPALCVSPEAILALVQRDGAEEERLATLDHVMSCAACHREYQWLTAVDQAGLESEGVSRARPRVWWRGTPLALAASIALLAGTAVVLSSVLRSRAEPERGGERGITLLAPGVRVAPGQPIAFTWRPLPDASRYVVEVQRADGSVAWADTTADTTIVLPNPSRVLQGGEYRWWVRELTDGAEPRSSALRDLRLTGR
jgi:hypothetical protein